MRSTNPTGIEGGNKYFYKINLFGAISCRGPCDFYVIFLIKILLFRRLILIFQIFEENLDSDLYLKIISQTLLPFMVEKYNLDCYLHQDNDRKHTSGQNQRLLKNLGIIWVIIFLNFKMIIHI